MFDPEAIERARRARREWEATELRQFLERQPESRSDCRTGSGLPVTRVYTPEDVAEMNFDEIGERRRDKGLVDGTSILSTPPLRAGPPRYRRRQPVQPRRGWEDDAGLRTSLLSADAVRHPADAERFHAGATAPQAWSRRDVLRMDRARPRALRRAEGSEADRDRRLPDRIVDAVARATARRIPGAMVDPRAGQPQASRRAESPQPGRPRRHRGRADRVRV